MRQVADGLAGHFGEFHWLRYADPAHGPHLRIRFRGDPKELGGAVLPALSRWCAGLPRQRLASGFSIEPYDQEIERYGGTGAITAAERVFATDSCLCLALLSTVSDVDQRLMATAMSAAEIAVTMADGAREALSRHRLDHAARQRFETIRPRSRAAWLARDLAPVSVPGRLPDGELAAANVARREALAAYRAALPPAQRAPCAAALAHMNANRLLGDAGAERIATALAADLLALRQQTLSPA